MHLPCTAHDTHPSYYDLANGYDWYRSAGPDQRRAYVAARLAVLATGRSYSGAKALHTSGSTGNIKHYSWGPGYEAMYSFFFNDIVRAGSQLDRVAVVTLVELRHGADNFIDAKHTHGNPVADAWINIGIGVIQALPQLRQLLYGRDVVVPPSHYEILHKYAHLGDFIDDRALMLSTGEPVSDYLVGDCASRSRELRDWMRCWDGGASFYTCRHGNRHWCGYLAKVEVDDGRLLSTDLYNLCQRFESYHNGDLVACRCTGLCPCGEETWDIDFKNRQDLMYFQSPSGAVLNYAELVWLVARARMDAGLRPDEFNQVCFGVSLSQWTLRVDYVGELTAQERDLLSSCLKQRGRALGFVDVSLRDLIEPSQRKLNRLYLLDGSSLLQSSR